MKFVAIDVETANADMASICSIGAVRFENGRVVDEWYSLVDPKDYFDGINVSIHGIDKTMVRGAPTYREASQTLHAMLQDAITVTHTHFDRVAIHKASARWAVRMPTCAWLDSARVARRTWAECARSGYGLADVCRLIGYEFQHHNALEDAKAAGHVMLAAMERTGLDLDGWLARLTEPIKKPASGKSRSAIRREGNADGPKPARGESRAAIRREGNADGPLHGEVIVFTGALAIPRREAADLAASVGCRVDSCVTKKTTLLVVGDTDVQWLNGHSKSSKHRKAEELAAKGQPIRIIRETDFRELVAMA